MGQKSKTVLSCTETDHPISTSESRNWKAWVSGMGITAWEDRLSELADYRKNHGHCNVPQNKETPAG
jgi:hypothetical protein